MPHDFRDEEPGTARVIPITAARRRATDGGAGAVEDRLAALLDFLRRRVAGEYEVDEFGFDPELNDKVLLELIRPLYRHWFRVETTGLANVPGEAGALVVANHSGTVPVDALMLQVALHDEHPAHRALRLLGADLVYQLPVLGHLSRKSGHTLACPEDADRLMRKGELVGVFPEGFKGVGKPFSERYKLQRFGRGGFVASAIRAQVPIIPCAIVGAEEIYPKIGDFRSLARLLGLPYIPITPLFPWLGPLGLVPLPSKWMIQFGEPVRTDEYDPEEAEDPMLVFNLTDQVRELIQQQLNHLRLQRGHAFPPFF
ncbi:lysophospholipid acyltransferase family protein [Sphaerisporangium sp. NPDC004334]